jgi:hypothetical protein
MRRPSALPVPAVGVAWLLGIVPYALPLLWQGPTQRQAALWMAAAGALGVGGALVQRWSARIALGAAALAVLGAGVVPTIGRTVPLLAVVAAALALAPGPTAAARPPRPLRTLSIALAGITWLREGSLALTLGLLAAAGAVVVLEWIRPTATAAVDRAIRRAAARLGEVVSYAVIAVVALPLLFVPALVGAPFRAVQRRRRRRAGTEWRDRGVAPRDERRDAVRPFAPAPVRERRLLNALGGVALVGALVLIGFQLGDRTADPPPVQVARAALPPTDADDEPDPNRGDGQPELADRPAFSGVPWADEVEAEFARYGNGHLPTDPELGYVVGDFDGVHLSVRDGVRTSLASTCACPRVHLWLLGGSSAFGWNQRDEHTIASHLVRLGEELGVAVVVDNFAVPGWTIDQERRHLERLLARRPAPDGVIVYDGFNDVMAAVTEAALAGRPLDPAKPSILDNEALRIYSTQGGELSDAGGPDAVGEAAAARHVDAQEAVRSALVGRDIRVWFALQGDAFASTAQLRHIEDVTGRPAAEIRSSEVARAFDAFARAMHTRSIDVRSPLAQLQEPVFSDPSHTNERGAQVAAATIMGSIGPLLVERAR